MKKIDDLIERVKTFKSNIPAIITQAVKDNEEIVLDWVTEDQLFEKGIDSDGKKLSDREPYTPITISIKSQKGQPTSRVTLRDSEDFHRSFFIKYSSDGFEIDASDFKTGGLVEKYGKEILGLSDDNLQDILRNYILPELLKKIKTI